MNISFSYPDYFLLFIPVILLIVFFYIFGFRNINFSGFSDLKKVYKNNSLIYKLKYILLFFSVSFFIIALTNPLLSYETKNNEDLKLHFIMDLSYSMIADDLDGESRYNVMLNGIKSFNNSEFILFAGGAKKIGFKNLVDINNEYIRNINLNNDGSSLGDAILFSSKFIDKDSKNLFFIFSDGVVNEGKNIIESLGYIKGLDIAIFTFAIGGNNVTEVFVDNGLGTNIAKKVDLVDEITLKKIALETNGDFFRIYNSYDIKNSINKIINENQFSLVKNNIFIANILYLCSFIMLIAYFFISYKNK